MVYYYYMDFIVSEYGKTADSDMTAFAENLWVANMTGPAGCPIFFEKPSIQPMWSNYHLSSTYSAQCIRSATFVPGYRNSREDLKLVCVYHAERHHCFHVNNQSLDHTLKAGHKVTVAKLKTNARVSLCLGKTSKKGTVHKHHHSLT
jgi:hypothetical protein